MKKLYQNWTFHNIISHPLSEITYLLVRPFSAYYADKWCGIVHDFSLPLEFENGRG